MAYRDLKAFPPEITQLIRKAILLGAPVKIPCETQGQAINRAITFRSYLKLVRNTPMQQLWGEHLELVANMAGVYVSGPGRSPVGPFEIVIHPFEPQGEFSLATALGDFEPPRSETVEETFFDRKARLAQGDAQALPETNLTNQQIWDIAKRREVDPGPFAFLSPRQRNLYSEWLLTGTPADVKEK